MNCIQNYPIFFNKFYYLFLSPIHYIYYIYIYIYMNITISLNHCIMLSFHPQGTYRTELRATHLDDELFCISVKLKALGEYFHLS